jgi:hypothetical protein
LHIWLNGVSSQVSATLQIGNRTLDCASGEPEISSDGYAAVGRKQLLPAGSDQLLVAAQEEGFRVRDRGLFFFALR